MKRLISSCVLALSGTTFLSASVMAAEPASCQNVRMGVVNWTDVIATSAMTQVLLDGLGYNTKQTSASQQIIFAGIRDQRLDLFIGCTGGRHRSVVVVEDLASFFRDKGLPASVDHRDLDR